MTASEMVTAAKAGIENLTPSEVEAELKGGGVVLVDIREPHETKCGVIEGALVVPRGMLEFRADPTMPQHHDALDPGRRVILYCAAGSRSALGAKTLQELGFRDVAHLEGGVKGWEAEGRPLQQRPDAE